MGRNQSFEQVLALLLDEVPAVLTGHVSSEASTAAWHPREGVLGSIGFGGADMRGSIILVAEPTVWRELAPPEVGDLSDVLLCDLAAELCNLLVGRFRNRLLRLGIELACGTPTAAYGHLSLPRLPASSALAVATHRLTTAAGCIYLRTDILFGDHFAFPTAPVSGLEPAQDDLFF